MGPLMTRWRANYITRIPIEYERVLRDKVANQVVGTKQTECLKSLEIVLNLKTVIYVLIA